MSLTITDERYCDINASHITHIDVTISYSEFCNSIITEMEELLPVKYVTVNTNPQKKRYNRYKS